MVCFSNSEEANQAFSPEGSQGRARVKIDDYTINYAPTEVYNTARLIEVIELTEGVSND